MCEDDIKLPEYQEYLKNKNINEETKTRENKETKQKPSPSSKLFTTIRVSTNDKTSLIKQVDTNNEVNEITIIGVNENLNGPPPVEDNNEEDIIDEVPAISSNRPNHRELKENGEESNRVPINQENKKGEMSNDTLDISQNQTYLKNIFKDLINENIYKKEVETVLRDSLEIGKKYLLYEFVTKTRIFSIINVIDMINSIAEKRLGLLSDFIELNSDSFLLLQDEKNINDYQDETLSNFIVDILKIPKDIIIYLILKEKVNESEKIKLLDILLSTKLKKSI